MLFIRRVLQIIFGLLLAAVIYSSWKSPNPNYESTIGLLGIALFVILILGPWWPSAEKIERAKTSLNHVIGIPNATPVVVNVLGVLFSLYEAWDSYAHPSREAFVSKKLLLLYSALASYPSLGSFLRLVAHGTRIGFIEIEVVSIMTRLNKTIEPTR